MSTVNQFDNLTLAFPHLRPLSTEFYTDEPYLTNKTRRSKAVIILGALSNYDRFRDLPEAHQNLLVRKIESGCVNETIRKSREDNVGCNWQTTTFVQRYNILVCDKARELDYTENQWLAPRVVSGEIGAYTVASMAENIANPGAARELIERREARLAAKVERKRCSGYPCPQCNANGEKDADGVPVGWAYIQNVQTRGADEAKISRAQCPCCGHIWELDR